MAMLLGSDWRRMPRLLRFFVVGSVNTLFGYGAFALLLWCGLHYALATSLATVAGIVFNFFTTGRLVFEGTRGFVDLLRFVVVYGLVYLVNIAALAFFDHQGVGPYVVGLILVVPMALLSYVLMHRVVFRKSPWL